MIREYVQWIGLLTNSNFGLDYLKQFEIFIILEKFVDKKGKRDNFLAVVLYSL